MSHLMKTERHTESAPDAISLGCATQERAMGFFPTDGITEREDIRFDGPHLLTVAPTGSGKGVSCAIPTLLTYPGQAVCVDIKGELYMTTARRRREMGQRVVKLDPFRIVDDITDAFNPLDCLTLARADLETDAQTLAALLTYGRRFSKDPFWDNTAGGLLSGILAHLGALPDEEKRTLIQARDLLHTDDTVYNLAVLLDTLGKKMPKIAYQEIAAFLQMPERETRPSVLATAQSYLKAYMSERVAATLAPSTFSLADFANGSPMTIYLIIPPDRLDSHAALLQIWLGTLFRAVFSRETPPKLRTLMLIDEAAQLGSLAMLSTAVTLCRTYGLRCWSFWQDVEQLRHSFPNGWRTIINNCGLQTFGIANHQMAEQLAEIFGCEPDRLADLPRDEQMLKFPHQPLIRARKHNYLRDRRYQGLYDSNRFYGHGR